MKKNVIWANLLSNPLLLLVLWAENFEIYLATLCQCPTPTDYFPILTGIQPPELCQQGATFSLAYNSLMDPKHLLYQFMVGPAADHKERLRSRLPFVFATCKLLNELFKLSI